MKEKDIKINFKNPNNPKYYKRENRDWKKCSKKEIEFILGYKL